MILENYIFLVFVVSITIYHGCYADIRWKYVNKNLENALSALELNAFASNLKLTGLDRELWKSGRLTLFAPTDEAFKKLNRDLGGQSLSAKALYDLLIYHMADEEYISKSWQNEELIPTKLIIYPIPVGNALDTANNIAECKLFVKFIYELGLPRDLRYKDGLSLFLPTDRAVKKMPKFFMQNLAKEIPALAELVRYHVVNGTFYGLKQMSGDFRLKTWEGSYLHGVSKGDVFIINKTVKIIRSYPVTNGVIHLIDSLLFPPTNPKHLLYFHKNRVEDI